MKKTAKKAAAARTAAKVPGRERLMNVLIAPHVSEKAARISNAAANRGRSAVGRKGGKSGDYEDWTVEQLRKRAKELGLTGYSGKRKSELISALRNH